MEIVFQNGVFTYLYNIHIYLYVIISIITLIFIKSSSLNFCIKILLKYYVLVCLVR
jgi:hypothetical protein